MRVLATLLPLLALGASVHAQAPAESEMSAYLLVYFKDTTHSLHMALSTDGYTFTAVNDGQPVIDGRHVAEQQGIRDPHITRGPDGAFYLAMTDLHIYAQRDGLRDTQWQRPGDQWGWGNNRGFVLMRSEDLINWTRSNLRIDQAYPELAGIGAAWAPQTVWDPQEEKLMLYFTMRHGNEHNRLYYAYTDPAYTRLVTRPLLLFEYPNDTSYIDGDLTHARDKWRLFYTPHDPRPGIKQAVSDQINQGFQYQAAWVDAERQACEAPNVWKRIGQQKWVLMYDIYGIQPHNFGFVETTDFKEFTNLGRFNDGVMRATNFTSPKHGAVVHLTAQEAKRLADHWGNAPRAQGSSDGR